MPVNVAHEELLFKLTSIEFRAVTIVDYKKTCCVDSNKQN